jgi:hypothetical protein
MGMRLLEITVLVSFLMNQTILAQTAEGEPYLDQFYELEKTHQSELGSLARVYQPKPKAFYWWDAPLYEGEYGFKQYSSGSQSITAIGGKFSLNKSGNTYLAITLVPEYGILSANNRRDRLILGIAWELAGDGYIDNFAEGYVFTLSARHGVTQWDSANALANETEAESFGAQSHLFERATMPGETLSSIDDSWDEMTSIQGLLGRGWNEAKTFGGDKWLLKKAFRKSGNIIVGFSLAANDMDHIAENAKPSLWVEMATVGGKEAVSIGSDALAKDRHVNWSDLAIVSLGVALDPAIDQLKTDKKGWLLAVPLRFLKDETVHFARYANNLRRSRELAYAIDAASSAEVKRDRQSNTAILDFWGAWNRLD